MSTDVPDLFTVEGQTATSTTPSHGPYKLLFGADETHTADKVKAAVEALAARPAVVMIQVRTLFFVTPGEHAVTFDPISMLARTLDGSMKVIYGAGVEGFERLIGT